MSRAQQLREEIDNYQDTVFAILGFVNFYRFDDQTRRLRDDVVVFQGRRLTPSAAKATTADGGRREFVTPDFGVLHRPGHGVLGDAKKSFPKDRSLWRKDFEQLMAYDDDLTGWPCPEEAVEWHDVVLLADQSRVPAVCDYYTEKGSSGEIDFVRPFAIVSFNRSDQRQAFFHFEKRLGDLSDEELNDRLHLGVRVRMDVLTDVYSMVKLYDSEPPLPYMAELIWMHVVADRASEDLEKYAALRKNQKLDVVLTLDEIVQKLHEGFSFRSLGPQDAHRQPLVPRKAWCRRACDVFVSAGMAKWIDAPPKDKVLVYFRKLDDVGEHMLHICVERAAPDTQLPLFLETPEDPSGSQAGA